MTRWIGRFIILSSVVATTSAYAQETTPGAGKAEVTIIPGGGTFFAKIKRVTLPGFGDYDFGGALAWNFTRVVGVEGELARSIGIKQYLADVLIRETTPNMLSYSGNVVFNAPGRRLVPYWTVGVGGLSVYSRPALGIARDRTFVTGNAGGGVKWYSAGGRWGLRGDYRFMAVRSNRRASDFFGEDKRYANRIYGGVVINAVR